MQRLPSIAFIIIAASSAPARVDAQRLITESDLLRFVWIAEPQISPDGSHVAFVRVSANTPGTGYDTTIWVVQNSAGAEPRRLTAGTRDLSPRWSPDGQRLAYVGDQQLNIIKMADGRSRRITDIPRGIAAPEWSPDGRTIAFTTTAQTGDTVRRPDAEGSYVSDVRIITSASFRANGSGYIDPLRRPHIWAIDVDGNGEAGAALKQLTSGEFEEANISWSPRGDRVFFTSNRIAESYYEAPDADLYSVGRDGGAISRVASIDGVISAYDVSADDTRVAFIGALNSSPVRPFNQPDLFVLDLTRESARNLTASHDFDVSGALTGDQRAPRGGLNVAPRWSDDGRAVVFVAAERGRATLKRVDIQSGRVENVTSGEHEIIAYSMAAGRVAMLMSTATTIGDLMSGHDSGGDLTSLTTVNRELFSELKLTSPEEFSVTSRDGRVIHSFIQKPPDFDASRKYPLILDIHGGPNAAWGHTFMHEFHVMAAKGYVVVYPNPRGSTTYGVDFANALQHRGPQDEFNDLMASVDAVVKRGYVDTSRLFVTGGSYGGFLTNWVVTQTARFKAAVSQRSIADRAAQWYTSDNVAFRRVSTHGAPFEVPAEFAERSPITFVAKVTTPMMFIEGDADLRTIPVVGGEPMFRALKYLKRETVMVRFPGEGHELSRSGTPWHRVERLQHIVGWFDKHMK